VLFSVFAIMAAFAAGSSVQAHSMAAAIREHAGVSPHVIGIAAGMLTGIVIIGGARKIAGVCTWLVPVMGVLFLTGCIVVIWQNRLFLPETVKLIIGSAFSQRAAAGGFTGAAVMTAVRVGMAKGLFTNEAGMGSMPMSAAAVDTQSPQKQAVVSMTGVFWDTIVMCAITGIAIVIRYFKKKRDDKLRETRIVLHDSPIVLSVALGRKSIYPDVENAILNIPALREKFTYPEKDSDDQIKKAIQKLSYDITIEEKLDISDPSALSETSARSCAILAPFSAKSF